MNEKKIEVPDWNSPDFVDINNKTTEEIKDVPNFNSRDFIDVPNYNFTIYDTETDKYLTTKTIDSEKVRYYKETVLNMRPVGQFFGMVDATGGMSYTPENFEFLNGKKQETEKDTINYVPYNTDDGVLDIAGKSLLNIVEFTRNFSFIRGTLNSTFNVIGNAALSAYSYIKNTYDLSKNTQINEILDNTELTDLQQVEAIAKIKEEINDNNYQEIKSYSEALDESLDELVGKRDSDNSFIYNMGGVTSDVLKNVLIKNPFMIGLLMFLNTENEHYLEARDAGKSHNEASAISAGVGIVTGLLENLGEIIQLGALNRSVLGRAVKSGLGEGLEEFTQEVVEIGTKDLFEYGDYKYKTPGDKWLQGGTASMYGAIGGVISGGTFEVGMAMEQREIYKEVKKVLLSRETEVLKNMNLAEAKEQIQKTYNELMKKYEGNGRKVINEIIEVAFKLEIDNLKKQLKQAGQSEQQINDVINGQIIPAVSSMSKRYGMNKFEVLKTRVGGISILKATTADAKTANRKTAKAKTAKAKTANAKRTEKKLRMYYGQQKGLF
ncbi:MAG: hypothetical protein LBC92_00360 [Rickettsiales bacterium]|jgi:hypothetical protein|nr:hypothetical protein [Rickettsiales bacterium]